jgi:uncharacterized repeat protein (TIGR03837 family)
VVDNFGDIGVVWRLARQLEREHGATIRLFVDDLRSFKVLEPAVDTLKEQQEVSGIAVMTWNCASALQPANLVIEAFAVELPDEYIAAMAAMTSPPVWLNLEYLSAEGWVGEHHLLPSPHARLPLTKYFFFPGFVPGTGGLIRESGLLAERDSFAVANDENDLHIFVFGYPNSATSSLFRAMSESTLPVCCKVTEGALADSLEGGRCSRPEREGNFSLSVIPFTVQRDFDRLLWKHDVLFVRGEDSFVRAQWAGKPFVWQIYPQSGNAHWVKLDAFLALYCDQMGGEAASAVRELWRAWNAEDDANVGAAWRGFIAHLPELETHAGTWASKLAQMPDLAANLLSFYQKTIKI